MLDAPAAEAAEPPSGPAERAGRRRRRVALVASAALVLALHAALLGEVGGPTRGLPEPASASMAVRTVEPEAAQKPAGQVAKDPVEAAATVEAPAAVAVRPRPSVAAPRRPREPALVAADAGVGAGTGSGGADEPATEPAASASATAAASQPDRVGETGAEEALAASVALAEAARAASAAAAAATLLPEPAASAPAPTLLAAGELPPPTYRTRLPPSATLRYQVRRGFLRGTGEIRWRAGADAYQLVLEARIAGLTLLVQTSEGGIDATGLAPVRFVDQRARRPAQAANFRRDVGTITYSGPGVEWPLLAGSQDRLSWMIQLAGIAAAEPELLVEGGRITMVVVGARGEASVWNLRSAGPDNVETVRGTVRAVKLVREGRSAYDSGAEIWLDPALDYFPAHATLRNSAGGSEYDLLLERVEPPP